MSYLPEPLAGFLDRLRAELVQECRAKAHVTILPPRPLSCGVERAWDSLSVRLQDFQPFAVELGQVEIFPVSQVIYLSVKTGQAELRALHSRLGSGEFAFEEPFIYHPHVTLAQDLDPLQVAAVFEKADARWKEFSFPHTFMVDRLTFVQNTLENNWTDLRGCPLNTRVAI
ncbi:MAG: 2'-5' RNA ligase family protein [Acidobacteriia bacterium]|nr:2'-5' RNA ligase family protein [Terriglobia bacterium]